MLVCKMALVLLVVALCVSVSVGECGRGCGCVSHGVIRECACMCVAMVCRSIGVVEPAGWVWFLLGEYVVGTHGIEEQ